MINSQYYKIDGKKALCGLKPNKNCHCGNIVCHNTRQNVSHISRRNQAHCRMSQTEVRENTES